MTTRQSFDLGVTDRLQLQAHKQVDSDCAQVLTPSGEVVADVWAEDQFEIARLFAAAPHLFAACLAIVQRGDVVPEGIVHAINRALGADRPIKLYAKSKIAAAPLDWASLRQGGGISARTPFGRYFVQRDSKGWFWYFNREQTVRALQPNERCESMIDGTEKCRLDWLSKLSSCLQEAEIQA